MRPIEINLATRPFRNNSLYWAGFGSTAIVLLALTVVNLWLFLGYGSAMQTHRQDLSVKQRRREILLREEERLGRKLSRLDFKGLATRAEFANEAIRRRVFSWTELFNRLEEVVPPTVMMMSIRPDIQPEGISIIAEGIAHEPEGLLQFEENLIRTPIFARIYPGSERREQRERQLHFSLQFDYLPAPSRGAEAAMVVAAAPGPAPPAVTTVPTGTVNQATPAPPSDTPHPPGAPVGLPLSPTPAPSAAGAPPPLAAAGPAGTLAAPNPPPSGNPAGGGTAPVPPPTSPSRAAGPPGVRQGPVNRPGGIQRLGSYAGPPAKPGGRRRLANQRGLVQPDAGERPTPSFVDKPIQDVLDFLTREWKMTFIFDGSFDLQQRVAINLLNMEEGGVVTQLCNVLSCTYEREREGVYRLTPRSGGEPLEEPPVEEAPVPEEKNEEGKESP